MLCDGDRGGSGLTIVDNNYSGWFNSFSADIRDVCSIPVLI